MEKPLLIFSVPMENDHEEFKKSLEKLKDDFNTIVQASNDGPYGIKIVHDNKVTVTELCPSKTW